MGVGSFSFWITVVVVGLAIFLLIPILLRVVHRIPLPRTPSLPPINLNLPPTTDAVLLIQPGGRVLYTNQQARQWFGYLEKEPNLEHLARRARPSDVFLGLCAGEGQARFSLDGRLVEGTSYYVPYDSTNAVLISLRHPQAMALPTKEGGLPEQSFNVLAELSQTMAGSLDLEATIHAVLDSVDRLIPSDYSEITLWDSDHKRLIPYRFVGLEGVDRHLEKANERYDPTQGYSGYVVTNHASLLIGNVDTYRAVRPGGDRKQYPFNSYLGTPLLMAGELLGTLELASLNLESFSQNDQELLRILSGQAAVALYNALLYQEEQHRIHELSGLAELTRAVGALQEPQELFERLVESISSLLDVSVLGFLIFNESQRSLEAQAPFIGIPTQFVELYRTVITPDSPAEQVWLAHETIVAPVAPDDLKLQGLNLAHLCQAAGIVNTVVVPLTSAGRALGYLQVADKRDGGPFDKNDLRLLEIVAGQAATIIENATLFRQSQERAQRAEALRRVASLTGSAATLDEILQFSLRELARLLRADVAAIFLVDESRGELRLHKESLFGISEDVSNQVSRLSMGDPLFRSTVTSSLQPFFTGNFEEDPQTLAPYRPILTTLQARSVIDVPLTVRNQGVGEIILCNHSPQFFDRNDLSMVATTAGQMAAAIERSSLYTQTDESLRRRVEQLTALTRISRELNTTLELKSLLQLVYDELLRTTQADCGTILLFDVGEQVPNKSNILFAIGDVVRDDLLPIEQSVLKDSEPVIVQDFIKPSNGEAVWDLPHEGVRSSIVVPIAYQEHVAGLIHLHSRKPGSFDATSLEIAQTLAIQAAIALGNTQRYHEQIQRTELLNRRVETMDKLMETTQSLHAEQPLEQSLESIAYGIQESTPFNAVLVSVYDLKTGDLVRITGAGIPLETMKELLAQTQPWSSLQEFLKPEFKVNRCYFIPQDRRPTTPPGLHVVSLSPEFGNGNGDERTWHSQDILLIPLTGASGQPLGLISVDIPRDGLRPDRPAYESLEVFASQAVLVIENFLKLEELKVRADSLKEEYERARKAVQISETHLPDLLHKDIEQTISVQRVSQRARRIRAGLDIAEIVNRQPNRANALLALGQEILTRMDMDIALIAEISAGGPRLVYVLGAVPASANPEALLGQRNPLRNCLQSGEMILVADLEGNEWQNTPLLAAMEARSFVCLPISLAQGPGGGMSGERANRVDAAVLVINKQPLPPFTKEDQQLYALVAQQTAITLENLRLLSEANRRLQEVNLLLGFSRQLGSLDPTSILQSLLNNALQVLPVAHAGLVALWRSERDCLVPQVASGYADNQRILEITYRSGEALPGQAFQSGTVLRVDDVDFARQYNLPSEHLLNYRHATGGRLPLSNLIIPIQTMDNKLGVLVLDNFNTSAAFTPDDQTLITTLAQQTALALENARLYQASEVRAKQLQALTSVASTITSSLRADELITSLLDQVKIILPYETGTLWLRQGDRLTIRAARGFEDAEERVGLSVAVEDSLLLKEMITTSLPISVGDVRQDVRFPSLVEPRYFSWLGVPLLSKGEVVGVVALEKAEPNFYNIEHLQAITTFAGQAAVALENANLFAESLRRTQELDQRSSRLALLNRLSIELSGSLDPNYILGVATRELKQAIDCTAVSAVMFDIDGTAWLRAEDPPPPAGLPVLLPDTPLFERLRESLGVFSTENVNQESILEPLQDFLNERDTRSLLVFSLATGTDLHGLLFAHANQPEHFSADEVELARTISNQVAVAIQNASLFAETQHLFAETRERSAELATLYELGVSTSQVLDQRRLKDITFNNVLRLLHADVVLLALLNETEDTITVEGIDNGKTIGPIVNPLSGDSFSEHVLKLGSPFLIRDLEQEQQLLPAATSKLGIEARSMLGVPLMVRGAAIGVISVQSYQPNVFDETQQRLLVQVTNQLAIALDNARLIASAQDYAAELERRVADRTQQVESEHIRTQTLLSIITELSTSLDLDLVLNRTLAVVNETMNAEHSLIMLVNPDEDTLFLRASLGYAASVVPKGGQQSQFKIGEGLVGWVISHRQAVMIADLWKDIRWIRHENQTTVHRSAIAVPLMMGEEVLGALLLFHRQSDKFTTDQLELAQATAKQIAVAINNAQLFRLIRDQAERLGDMLRTQHVETSRSQAILEAVADGVLVTDANGKITLFNASAEHILALERDQLLGQSLEHFIGLFGKAAHAWMQTIRTWSEDPNTYLPGDTYAEQIELDNRRVVSVHLSPVRLRNDFLGTVSIFRDITHQVEVDRLKSEFVATVSHELRTPMTSIKGYVDILLMGAAGKLSDQQTHFLEIVKTNTERLAVLVNDLLDISRIEAGRVTLSLQSLDLREVADDSVATLNRRMEEENRRMEIKVDLPTNLPHVMGDAERVRQIVDNLMENAYQYTNEGGHILLSMRQVGDEVQIAVKDDGIGIQPTEQARVFERFYRGEDPLVLATSGTGLGLSIVKYLVEMHSGHMWLESTGVRGEGSVFSFTLPIYTSGEET